GANTRTARNTHSGIQNTRGVTVSTLLPSASTRSIGEVQTFAGNILELGLHTKQSFRNSPVEGIGLKRGVHRTLPAKGAPQALVIHTCPANRSTFKPNVHHVGSSGEASRTVVHRSQIRL